MPRARPAAASQAAVRVSPSLSATGSTPVMASTRSLDPIQWVGSLGLDASREGDRALRFGDRKEEQGSQILERGSEPEHAL